jgi:hypothetical protein
MSIQSRPICFGCDERIEHDPLFEAPCGHDGCSSAVFHGLCLMEWRERRQQWEEARRIFWRQWVEQHSEGDRER